jgi:flagellar biogenesis protein FliO
MIRLGILLLFSNSLWAQESLGFKKELVSDIHWTPYVLVLVILFSILFILAKYSKKSAGSGVSCKVIEKITVHHKTRIYIIDYKGQNFLIADNQNSVAIQPLSNKEPL